jgi:prophage tail gpP-like protein
MGRMYANAAPYTAKVSTWFAPDGALWEPGDTVTVHAPDAMIYEPYDFTIRKVSLQRSKSSETASLDLILPGSLDGKIPETLPWD